MLHALQKCATFGKNAPHLEKGGKFGKKEPNFKKLHHTLKYAPHL